MASVFVATTPNPTTGFVFVVKRSELTELNWTVEEAVKVVMSGGVLVPASIPTTTPSAPPKPPLVEPPKLVPTGR